MEMQFGMQFGGKRYEVKKELYSYDVIDTVKNAVVVSISDCAPWASREAHRICERFNGSESKDGQGEKDGI